MRRFAWLILATFLALGCDDEETYPEFEVISVAFENGGVIPYNHTCFGSNVSPPLVFAEVPADVETYAIIMDEPGALGGPFIHWMIWGIPKEIMVLDQNYAQGILAEQNPDEWDHIHFGPNSEDGELTYTGPCPNDDQEHSYDISVYALSEVLDLTSEDVETVSDLKSAMNGKIVGKGVLMGVFTH